MNTTATTVEPITPATFGPLAWGRMNALGLASGAIWRELRAAMGTAEIPAEPIKGLIFSLRNRLPIMNMEVSDADQPMP